MVAITGQQQENSLTSTCGLF